MILDFFFDGAAQRALASTLILCLSACPVGVFLMLRRMSLMGDAMSHAIMPGAALGFLAFGVALLPMTLGGLVAGLLVALAAGAVSRVTVLREDASLAAFYLFSVALGVVLFGLRGEDEEMLHILFGQAFAVDRQGLMLIAAIATVSLAAMAVLWRPLVAEGLDPLFLRSVSRSGPLAHSAFLVLVVLNLVGGFRVLGTLMAVGLMMLPAIAARLWCRKLEALCGLAILFGIAASVAGLLFSHATGVASGPAVVLCAGVIYLVSLAAAPNGLRQVRPQPHRHKSA
jgi:zinc/manganese transport system permease protein